MTQICGAYIQAWHANTKSRVSKKWPLYTANLQQQKRNADRIMFSINKLLYGYVSPLTAGDSEA